MWNNVLGTMDDDSLVWQEAHVWETYIIFFISKATNIWTHVGHLLSYQKTNHQDWIRLKIRLKAQPSKTHARKLVQQILIQDEWLVKETQQSKLWKNKSLMSSCTVGEKADSQLRHVPINWRLNLSKYLTCLSRIKSVQKSQAKQRANISITEA